MPERKANATWKGTLTEGEGTLALGSGVFEGKFSFATRMGDEPGTNPEELLGAALAGCYSMALNATFEKQGKPTKSVKTEARVFLGKDEGGFKINRIDLDTAVEMDGVDDADFQQVANDVKKNCIVSLSLIHISEPTRQRCVSRM
ncbi:MAG: OsmC family peroxiredoxin, partial [Pyrinomonadaceae bacterium]|nr:OsmC family peroxiredoxin [Pyrinomonadaceae bacterium]